MLKRSKNAWQETVELSLNRSP